MKKNIIALLVLLLACATAMHAALPADGVAGYLYNPQSGKFLSHGVTAVSNSGAKVDSYGVPLEIKNEGSSVSEFSDATYNYIRFQMGDYYGRYLRIVSGGLDCAGTSYHKWAVTEVSEDRLVIRCIYKPSQVAYAMQGYYVGIDENDALVLVDAIDKAAVWQFVDAATQKAIVADAAKRRLTAVAAQVGIVVEDQSALESAVAVMASMDKTSEISNPTMFENTSGWTVTNIQGTAINNGSYRIQNAAGGQSVAMQTVSGLPSGLYKVTVQSFYRASVLARCVTYGDKGYTFSNAYFRANDNEVLIKDWYAISTDNHSKPTSRSQIKDDFDDNAKYTNTVYTYVGDDGLLNLTIAVPSYSAGDYPNWICYNNVKLTYYYKAEDLTSYETMLAAAVASAQTVAPLPAQAAADLQAIVAANNKSYATSDAYQAAIAAINDAVAQAQTVARAYTDYLDMKTQMAALHDHTVYTDNAGAEDNFTQKETAVEDAVQSASLATAADTIAAQQTVLWEAALGFMKQVTVNEGKGFDLTWMIQDADFSATDYQNYWTEACTSTNAHGVVGGDNKVMRYYNSPFDLSQKLPYTLPAGAYRMRVDGFERTNDPMDTAWNDYQTGNSVVTGVIYLNDNEQPVMNLFDYQGTLDNSLGGEQPSGASFYTPNASTPASKYLAAGYYPNTLIGVLAADTTVTIGYRCANTAAWTCVDNFRLEYIGEVPRVALRVQPSELTPLCVPFTLSQGDEGVEALYGIGSVEEGRALLYAVATVKAGTPCVARFSTSSFSAPMEITLASGRQTVLPWEGGLLSSTDDYGWRLVDLKGKETQASALTFEVMDYQNMTFNVNVENLAARRYLSNVTYSGSTAESKVAAYNVAPPVRRDIPNAVMIPMPAFEGEHAFLAVTDDSGHYIATATVLKGETQFLLYNLLPQMTYTYSIVDDDNTVISRGQFNTVGHLRMVYAPSAYNIRDLGGWKAADNKRTTYGHLFRGSTLNGYVTCLAEDLQRLRHLGIGGEIDLRWKADYDKDLGCGTSAFGFAPGEHYFFAAANDYTAANLSETATQQRLKLEFEFIVSHLRQGKAVYFHCAWGADRTGMLAFLLEGLLGLPLDQLYKDYELTSFSAAPGATNRLKTSFQDRVNVIMALGGSTLRDRFENYFLNRLGVSADDVAYFRSVMLADDSDILTDVGAVPTAVRQQADAWYSVSGMRHAQLPTRKGLYIRNGQKVVVK